MTTEQLIELLRHSVNIQNPESAIRDEAYLSMTDAQILLYLNSALTRDFPDVSLASLPSEDVYPLLLLAKKELYYALAVASASLYDLGADGGYIKRSDRFNHYMKLIQMVDSEYKQYKEDGGAGGNTLTSYDVTLSNRYNTKRNYEKGFVPVLSAFVVSATDTAVEVQWNVKISRFFCYKVYYSTSPILDLFAIGDKVAKDATLLATIRDSRQKMCRIEGLSPETKYYILIVATDLSALTGYSEIEITTEASA